MFLDEGMSGMRVQFMPKYEEYLRTDGRLVVKVNKAIYGLIQSAKLWYKELTGHLVKNSFKVCKTDECVLVKKTAEGKYVVVLLYVDDILVLSGSAADRYTVKTLLEDKYEKVTHAEGKRLPYLGMTIIKMAVGYEVTMSSYIDDTLKLHGKPVREYVTPAKQDIFEACKTAPMLSEKAKFHSVVAKLLYLGKRGRPDILMPVQYLCTRVRNPATDDEKKLERILGYLKLTKAWTRAFNRSPFDHGETYIDVSFATHDDGKGQSAYVVMIGNTLVHESCKKQKIITRNSTEAELVVLSDYLLEGELIEDFLMEIGHMIDEDVITDMHLIYQDNQSTMVLVTKKDARQEKPRTKYMKVRQEFVCECLATGEIEVKYIKTSLMLVDLFTKALGGEQLHKLAEALLGKHRFSHFSNRGAVGIVAPTTVESSVPVTSNSVCKHCSNQAKHVRELCGN